MKAVINQVYNADIEAIRNLSSVATQLTTKGGLIVPGQLQITDSINLGDPSNMSGTANTSGTASGKMLMFDNTFNGIAGKGIPANKIRLHNNNNAWIGGFGLEGGGVTYNSGDSHRFYVGSSGTKYGDLALNIDGAKNTTINGELYVNNKLQLKENRARYIRIGNKEVPELRQDYWTLIEAKVYNNDGINIASKKPVAILEGTAYDNNAAPPGNITDGRIFTNNAQGDNWTLGYHGNPGVNVVQIDLGANNYISQIELYNRWSVDVDWRMNGTTIELFDESGARNKIIYTGLWHRQYSKTFLL